jgi:ketosteroid isomerase-like protein
MSALAKDKFISAWNTQDVDKVLAVYTEDLVYIDPNTHGEINNRQAMRRYLTKLFAAWEMHWTLRTIYAFKDINGATVRWHATFKKTGGKETVEAEGMDLVIFEGNRIKRNEVYFDRAALASLLVQ